MKKNLLLTALFLPLVFFLPISASGNATQADCTPVEANGEWQDYTLEKDTYAYCPLTLESNGHLDLSFLTTFDSLHYVTLLDPNYEKVNSTSIDGAGSASPKTVEYSYDLTAGTYYARVESWNGCHGLFRLKADFTPSRAPEPDGGSDFGSAVPYQPSDITGFLSSSNQGGWLPDPLPEKSQNMEDYYRFDARKGTYDIQLTTLNPDASIICKIYNSSYLQIDGTIREPSASVELNDETYYFCVISNGSLCGDYHLQIDPSEETAAETELEMKTETEIETEAETETETEMETETETEMETEASSDTPTPDTSESGYRSISIKIGENIKLDDISLESDTEGSTIWRSSDCKIAVVSNNGTAFGISAGTVWFVKTQDNSQEMTLYKVVVEE